MNILIPEIALVLLIGASSSGKSTFAKTHFLPSEIVSSDYCRYLVSDDENNQKVSKQAFEVLHTLVDKRLEVHKFTVVDATNVLEAVRNELLEIANKHHILTVAIVFNLNEEILFQRSKIRTDRKVTEQVIKYQMKELQYSLLDLKKEGFYQVTVMNTLQEIQLAKVYKQSLYCDQSNEHGPFDIVGDVHGCYDELFSLMKTLGYTVDGASFVHPFNRKMIFLGDLVDRGPKIVEVLKLVMSLVESGMAYCVQGNHDNKLFRKLNGHGVQVKNGLEDSLKQLAVEPESFKEKVREFLKTLPHQLIFDEGKLVVAHAGMKEEYIGQNSKKVRSFALYGETTGEVDAFGLPVRALWASDYKGKPLIVYGHTPNMEPLIINHSINIDTGCVFGNTLTAYRYPEQECVSIKALRQYSIPSQPIKKGE